MIKKRKQLIIASFTYAILTILLLYFKLTPIIINALVTDIIILSLIILFLILLVISIFDICKKSDLYFIIPQILIFVFLIMAIPNLRLTYPPLHDPYYYYASYLNVGQYSTLDPILSWWYTEVDFQLHFPQLQLLTASLVDVTGIDPMQLMRFQEPFIGIIFFLAVYIMAMEISHDIKLSVMAALLSSLSEPIIFYLAEYHPQGYAFTLFVLLTYVYFKSRSEKSLFILLSFVFIFVFVLCHHFSSLFIGLLAGALALMPIIAKRMPIIRECYSQFRFDANYWLLIFIATLSYHVFIYFSPLKRFLIMIRDLSPSGHIISFTANAPSLEIILNFAKWITFALAFLSLVYVMLHKKKEYYRLMIILGCILGAGIVGSLVIFSPSDRILGFSIPFIAIFAAMTLVRINDHRGWKISDGQKKAFVVSIALIPLVAGIYHSQPIPAYFIQSSEEDSYYWYSNHLPHMDEYGVAGNWIQSTVQSNSTFGVQFDGKIIPFYFGKIPKTNIFEISKDINPQYYLINPSMHYESANINHVSPHSLEYNKVNCIGEVVIYAKK